MNRAAESLEDWKLTPEEAESIKKAFVEGTAKPKIEIKKCPEYVAGVSSGVEREADNFEVGGPSPPRRTS